MGKVSYSEEIQATPEQIWTVLSDVTRLPDWAYTEGRFPHLVEGQYGSEQHEGIGAIWIGTSTDGQTARQKITAWEPPHKLAYELDHMENAAVNMLQANTFELEPLANGTRITWTVDWKLTGFSLNSVLLRLTGSGAFEEMMAGSLEQLKRLVEQEVTA